MEKAVFLVLLFLVNACAKPPMLSTAKDPADAFRECHQFTEDKSYLKANECLELLKSRYPGTPEAIRAELEMADNDFRQNDYLVAVEAYKNFARLHPGYPEIDYVYYRTGQAYLKESPSAIDRDQQYLDDAIHYFSLALNQPESLYRGVAREKWNEARRRLAARSFYIGRFYSRSGEYLSAIPRFEEVITKYPELGFDEPALYAMGRAYLELGEREKAGEVARLFAEHFPESRYRKKLVRSLD